MRASRSLSARSAPAAPTRAAAPDRRDVAGHHRAGLEIGLEHAVEALLRRQDVVVVVVPGLAGLVLPRGEVEIAFQALGPDGEAAVFVAAHAVVDVARVGPERVGLERGPGAEQVGMALGEAA
jgi:hypothetical protein